jgi:hypothetical protein
MADQHVVLSLDRDALKALASSSSPPSREWGESLLRIAQILSIVGAGFWTLYVWIAFDERKNDLALKQADVQYLQTQLSIEETRLNIQVKRAAGEQLAEVPISISSKFESHRIGTRNGAHIYLVSYEYRITNVGAHTIIVDDILLDAFVGKLRHTTPLPSFVNSFREPGAVRWIQVKPPQGFIFSDWEPGMKIGNKYEKVIAKHGSGGTGRANPGEMLAGSASVIAAGQPNDLIGFSIILHAQAPGISRAGKQIDHIERLGVTPQTNSGQEKS